MNRISTTHFLAALGFLAVFGISAQAEAATFEVVAPTCTGTGSFSEAVTQANQSPGTDIIDIQVSEDIFWDCPPVFNEGREQYPVFVTESVVINGNGARINGGQSYVSKAGGVVNGFFRNDSDCPTSTGSGYLLTGLSSGFISAGSRGADNAGIDVVVNDLTLVDMSGAVFVRKNASATFNNVSFINIRVMVDCNDNAFLADSGADLTLHNVFITGSKSWQRNPLRGLIENVGASATKTSKLTITHSKIDYNFFSGAVSWRGDLAIVSSAIYASGGIELSDGNGVIINSLLAPAWPMSDYDVVKANDATLAIKASTLSYLELVCPPPFTLGESCQTTFTPSLYSTLAPLQTAGSGLITLEQSAVQVLYGSSDINAQAVLSTADGGAISADQYSFVQPVPQQDGSALRALTGQPNLIVDAPSLVTTDSFAEALALIPPSTYAPLLGDATTPGLLIDNIPNAEEGGANALVDHEGNFITKDVYGNARVDENNRRSTGAVQMTLAPHLAGSGIPDAVSLAWSKPRIPTGQTLAFYEVCYGEGNPPQPETLGTTCPATLLLSGTDTETQSTVSGLSGGQPYWFLVRANTGAAGVWSNLITVKPTPDIKAPPVSANPGNSEVTLNWTAPDGDGAQIVAFIVNYRPTTEATWQHYAEFLGSTATSATISGLSNGTEYVFSVRAQGNGGEISAAGEVTSTPIIKTQLVSKSKGGGAMGLYSLLIMAGLLMFTKVVRARQFLVLIGMTLMGGLGAQDVYAEGFYLEAGVGSANHSLRSQDIRGDITDLSISVDSIQLDKRDSAYRLTLGYSMASWLAVEVGYQQLGDVTLRLDGQFTDLETQSRQVSTKMPVAPGGFIVGPRFTYEIQPRWYLDLHTNLFFWESDNQTHVDGVSVSSGRRGEDWSASLATRWQSQDDWYLGVEYGIADVGYDIRFLNLNLGLVFF